MSWACDYDVINDGCAWKQIWISGQTVQTTVEVGSWYNIIGSIVLAAIFVMLWDALELMGELRFNFINNMPVIVSCRPLLMQLVMYPNFKRGGPVWGWRLRGVSADRNVCTHNRQTH